jgi:hypothetical protein
VCSSDLTTRPEVRVFSPRLFENHLKSKAFKS